MFVSRISLVIQLSAPCALTLGSLSSFFSMTSMCERVELECSMWRDKLHWVHVIGKVIFACIIIKHEVPIFHHYCRVKTQHGLGTKENMKEGRRNVRLRLSTWSDITISNCEGRK